MADNGVITAHGLLNSSSMRTQLAGDIIRTAAERAILNNPAVVRIYAREDLE